MYLVSNEGSLFVEIIHLNCRSPDRRVRRRGLQFIQCDSRSVICVLTIDHCDTSLLVVWQHQFSAALLQHAVTSNHVHALERNPLHLSVPLLFSPRDKDDV